jgi:hypothetical protein
MACSGCGRKRAARAARQGAANMAANVDEVMGGYKYLNDRQIKARLEVYKKKYCSGCDGRYECTYEIYERCKKHLQ